MKVLVVGGAGYVGSHTVRLLLAQGHEVWVYDNLSLGHRESVPAGRLIEGNLTDRALLMQVMRDKEIEAVMHFAAYALVGESVQHPAMYYQNNVIATFELLEAMRAVGVWRFVFSSTTATYGQPEKILPRTRSIRMDLRSSSWSERWQITHMRMGLEWLRFVTSMLRGHRRTLPSEKITTQSPTSFRSSCKWR